MKFEHMDIAFKAAIDLGLSVLINSDKENANYFHFSDGKNIGYIQFCKYGEYSMSICYQPSKCNGDGASFKFQKFFNSNTCFKDLMSDCLKFDPTPLTRGNHTFYKDFDTFCKEYWNINNCIVIKKENDES